MFCQNQLIRYIDVKGNSKIQLLGDLEKNLNSKKYLKEQIKKRKITLIPCGKCDVCIQTKKNVYVKRVKSEFKNVNYCYLITLTFNNDNVETILNKEQKEHTPKELISYYSTLSKAQISNIIKNWKNKFNRYYGYKVKFSYFLSGEYGEKTERAHYHIILMLQHPIPNLVKENVRGNHYKSQFMESKQYNHYDIEPIYIDDAKKSAQYLTNYLNKSNDKQFFEKYNRFQEKQIKYLKEHNFNLSECLVIKNKEQLQELFNWSKLWEIGIRYIPKLEFKRINYQQEFIKMSRGLGISKDHFKNIENGVFTPYYRDKYIRQVMNLEPQEFLKDSFNFIVKGDDVLNAYEHKRRNNIIKYFGKEQKIIKPKPKNNSIM